MSRASWLTLFVVPFLGACSIYQSPSRKFLEQKDVFSYAGVSAAGNFVTSHPSADTRGWIQIAQLPLAQVYSHETGEFEMRVIPIESQGDFSCDFAHPSAQDMFEKIPAAVEFCVTEWHREQ